MKTLRALTGTLWVGALLATISSCTQSPASVGERAPPTRLVSRDPLVVEVRLATDGDRMAFDFETFEVPAGAEVRLVFKNTAQKPMFHNWVLVTKGSEEAVLGEALQAGYERAWVSAHPAVLAATGAPRPGEESSVTFSAPPPGVYPYLCTVPGHAFMRGRMIVRAPSVRRRS